MLDHSDAQCSYDYIRVLPAGAYINIFFLIFIYFYNEHNNKDRKVKFSYEIK
jgi:hypothetical protein